MKEHKRKGEYLPNMRERQAEVSKTQENSIPTHPNISLLRQFITSFTF